MTIELTADRYKINVSEQVSTGDYENHSVRTTVEGDVNMTGDLSNGRREELQARLLAIERDVQAAVERAAENRLRLPEDRDYGVPERGGDE